MSEGTLTMAEEMGLLQFTAAECAKVLGVEELDPAQRKDFERGRLLGLAHARKALYDLARAGSVPAVERYMRLVERAERLDRTRQGGRGE